MIQRFIKLQPLKFDLFSATVNDINLIYKTISLKIAIRQRLQMRNMKYEIQIKYKT